MSVMLASDANNPNFAGAYNPDAALTVQFIRRPVLQPFRTEKEGRPIYEDVDFIRIFTPGNNLNIIDTPVREEHKQRFPRQWQMFSNAHSADTREVGTPVTQWPYLTASQGEEFKALKFFTVEQIANASDMQLQSLGMVGGAQPYVIRDRARAYLAAAAGTAAPEAAAAELAQTKLQMAEMQKQLNALLAAQNGMTPIAQPAAEKPKRKRRTKEEMAADAAAPSVPETPPAEADEGL